MMTLTPATTAGGRAPGPARDDPAARRAAGLRPASGAGKLAAGRLLDFCGDLGPYRRGQHHGTSSLPAVYAGERADIVYSVRSR
jgi:hypothetical protein